MNLSIREIKNEDFSECADILVAAYKGAPWNNTWTKKEAAYRIESTMSGFNSRGYVVEKNNKIIGMCLGRIDYYFNNWNQFCIDEFNVLPAFQREYVGKNLLIFICTTMENNNINRIFLTTGGNQAEKFYKNNGFSISNDGVMMEYKC